MNDRNLPAGWAKSSLENIRLDLSRNIDPRKMPGEIFELYSVPSFSKLQPEIVAGSAIGSSKRTVEVNTVLLCKINPRINRVWTVGNYSSHRKIASTEWLGFSEIQGLHPKFLCFCLQQEEFRNYLATNASGVGGSLMRIRGSTLANYPFPLPPLPEHAGQLLERILVERRARWDSQQKRRGRYKEPAAPDTSALPELPEGWTWAKLLQLGELNRGKSKHRPRNDPRLLGGPYPFVQTGDIKKSRGLVTHHSQTYTDFGLLQSRLWPSGTLCITIAANIADTGILTYPACFPDSVVGFICDGDFVTTKFLEVFVRTEKDDLERFSPSTTQKNINLKTLSDLAIPLPPLAEQHRIVAEVERRLSVIQQAETAVETSLKRAERLRQSILKRAFSGQLVPQDPNDEPAAVLLARIQAERAAAAAAAKAQRTPRRRRRPRPAAAKQLSLAERTP